MVNLLVALAAEGRPLIQHFGLEPLPGGAPFQLFRGGDLQLVVSGIGKVAAAAAAGYLYHLNGSHRDQAWLNLGLGGHRELAVGAVRLAHKVSDAAECWYPPRVFPTPCATAEVRTVPEPERQFSQNAVYDMEASGFYATCTRFSTGELVHVLKIISDNAAEPARRPSRREVGELMGAQLPVVERVIGELQALAAEQENVHEDPEELQQFLGRWRFTVTQQFQLRDLLRRWQLIKLGVSAMEAATERQYAARRDARHVLSFLREELG